MKRHITRSLIGVMAVAGIATAVLASIDLSQAIKLCQRFYSVDTVSLEAQSDLEDDVQSARQALLTTLIGDVTAKTSTIELTRAAGQRVQTSIRRLRLLDPPEILRLVDRFERSWYDYQQIADQMFQRSSAADLAGALALERTSASASFSTTVLDLRSLKNELEEHTRVDSATVSKTIKSTVAAFAEFAMSIVGILIALAISNHDRKIAMVKLKASNDALDAAKNIEQQRVAILQMISSHAPLLRTLQAVAELPSRCGVRAGVSIWTANDNGIELVASANLPDSLMNVLRTFPLSPKRDLMEQLGSLGEKTRAHTETVAMTAFAPGILRDNAGHLIGLTQVFAFGNEASTVEPLAHHLENLAVVAIENTSLYERLAFQAQHDVLTGLPNRLLFHDRLDQAIHGARRHRQQIGVMWIDLDRYKQINDTLGHSVGDELLCEVGRRIQSCLRETDTVARVGGDEFTVLITDVTQPIGTEVVSMKIMEAISRPMSLAGHQISITASAGVSLFPEHAEEAGLLIRNADLAMYSAKEGGRNQCNMFRPDLGAAATRRLEIEGQLKTALERNEFSLVYQPLMTHDGRLDGLEALLRWTNPSIGEILPEECIPIAEEMGLICKIGEWVTREACAKASAWLRSGYELGRIAVNISAIQCIDPTFADSVERILAECGLAPSKLEFEITETALIRNLDRAIVNIQRLRSLGVRFAIDDFGTGYSSLSQLQTLPVDSVKIDRAFIKDLEYDGNGCTTLVRGIIGLAHNLNLDVVAEGVETEEQFSVLRTLGCDVKQGFFLHRPMESEAISAFFRKDTEGLTSGLNSLALATTEPPVEILAVS